MVRISVQPELQDEWRPVLERQLNLTLGRLRDQLSSLRVRFAATPVPRGEATVYRCELRGRTVRGTVYRNTARSTDGSTAISDVLARTCRAIARDRQMTRPDAARRRP